MSFIKKNKFTIIVIAIFIIMVLIGVKAKDLLFPNQGKALYGNRLDGIEEVKIPNQKFEQIIGRLSEEVIVEKVTSDVRGKLVNFTITVKNDAGRDSSKELATKILENFDDKQKSFYDFQVFIKKDTEEAKDFPIIGYKHREESDFSWTKDREAA